MTSICEGAQLLVHTEKYISEHSLRIKQNFDYCYTFPIDLAAQLTEFCLRPNESDKFLYNLNLV